MSVITIHGVKAAVSNFCLPHFDSIVLFDSRGSHAVGSQTNT